MNDTKRESIGDYVRQVREATQQYAKDLLTENEKLLALAVALHREKEVLRERLDAEADAHRAFAVRFAEVEQLNSNLASLYVASYRLHGTLSRPEVLATLEEIVINIVGSEKFAVFEFRTTGAPLEVVLEHEIDERQRDFDMSGPWAAPMQRGETWIATEANAEPRIAVPLRIGDKLIGAIVIFRLLDHKPSVEAFDLELFDLLATHAATALHCSRLNEWLAP